MLIIGLTGGIGCGKSTATDYFRSLGVPIIDADEISHQLVAPGSVALQEIITQFGEDIINKKGELDRATLRQIVFNDEGKRKILERILHPRINAIIRQRITALKTQYCIVSIPLLVETEQQNLVDRVLVIDTPTALQIERLRQRNAFTDSEIKAILASQAKREDRLRAADDIIVNDSSLEIFKAQIEKLHRMYMQTAIAPKL